MGTSGGYGGSQRQAWQRARNRFDEVLADPGDAAVPSLVQAIAQALVNEDPPSLHPEDSTNEPLPNDQTLARLLVGPPAHVSPIRPATSGGTGGGGGGA